MIIKSIFDIIKNYRLFSSVFLSLRSYGRTTFLPIRIHRNVKIKIHKNAKFILDGSSFLLFGEPSGYRYCRSSYFSVGKEAIIRINRSFLINDNAYIIVRSRGKLTLGNGYISSNSHIICTNSIEIGNDVAIADGVQIRDSDDHDILYDGVTIQSTPQRSDQFDMTKPS